MILACSPKHPLGQNLAVRPEQISGLKYVAFNRALTIRKEVDRFLREQGCVVDVLMEFDNIENIKKAVEIDAGVALLPEPTVRREVEAGSLVALSLAGCRFVRPLGIIHRRPHRLTTAAQRLINLLRQPAATLNGQAHSESPATQTQPTRAGRNGSTRPSKRTV